MDNSRKRQDKPDPIEVVAAAIATLGEATAAGIAEHAGMAYPTVTPKLRALEEAGRAERGRHEGRTLWRLTETGPAATPAANAATGDSTDAEADGEQPAPGEAGPNLAEDQPAQISPPIDPVHATAPTGGGDEPGQPGQAGQAGHGDPTNGVGDDQQAYPAHRAEGPADPDTPPAPPTERDQSGDTEAAPVSVEPHDGPAPAAAAADAGPSRRTAGSLRGSVLDLLEANPHTQYKTSELCRLIDQANAGSGAAKASAGAVHNAVIKLVRDGKAVQTAERPATFALAPAGG